MSEHAQLASAGPPALDDYTKVIKSDGLAGRTLLECVHDIRVKSRLSLPLSAIIADDISHVELVPSVYSDNSLKDSTDADIIATSAPVTVAEAQLGAPASAGSMQMKDSDTTPAPKVNPPVPADTIGAHRYIFRLSCPMLITIIEDAYPLVLEVDVQYFDDPNPDARMVDNPAIYAARPQNKFYAVFVGRFVGVFSSVCVQVLLLGPSCSSPPARPPCLPPLVPRTSTGKAIPTKTKPSWPSTSSTLANRFMCRGMSSFFFVIRVLIVS